MAEPVKILVVLNGIQYTDHEGLELIRSLLSRNMVNVDSVEILGAKKKEPARKPARKKSHRKKTTRRRNA